MLNKITKGEMIGFSLAIAVVAFFIGRATATLPYATVYDAKARAVAPAPDDAAPESTVTAAALVPAPAAVYAAPAAEPAPAKKRVIPTVHKLGVDKIKRLPPGVLKRPAKPRPPAAPTAAAPSLNYGALATSPSRGAKDPLVSVVICTDFQCPVCSRAAREFDPVMEKFADKVRFELKNNALKMHRNAERAAIAGLAAQRQGKFWHMHDEMFRQQRFLDDKGIRVHARSVGLKMEQLEADMKDPTLRRQVDAESALCMALGARGTPTFFIDGERHVGWGSALAMERIIQHHIELAEKALAEGTPRGKILEKLVKTYATEPRKYEAMMLRHVSPDPVK